MTAVNVILFACPSILHYKSAHLPSLRLVCETEMFVGARGRHTHESLSDLTIRLSRLLGLYAQCYSLGIDIEL